MTIVEAELTAVVWKLLVQVGDAVDEGDELLILESMKMEIPVEAESPGIVHEIHVSEGDAVSPGAPVVTLRPGSGASL